MENNYWNVDEWLIFKPVFNEKLTNYYDVINKYKKIIFSDYNEPLIAIETINILISKYIDNFIENKFNKKIDLSNHFH